MRRASLDTAHAGGLARLCISVYELAREGGGVGVPGGCGPPPKLSGCEKGEEKILRSFWDSLRPPPPPLPPPPPPPPPPMPPPMRVSGPRHLRRRRRRHRRRLLPQLPPPRRASCAAAAAAAAAAARPRAGCRTGPTRRPAAGGSGWQPRSRNSPASRRWRLRRRPPDCPEPPSWSAPSFPRLPPQPMPVFNGAGSSTPSRSRHRRRDSPQPSAVPQPHSPHPPHSQPSPDPPPAAVDVPRLVRPRPSTNQWGLVTPRPFVTANCRPSPVSSRELSAPPQPIYPVDREEVLTIGAGLAGSKIGEAWT
ncbi:uncharacterized protein LOC141550721 [Sminthopsis crassicaudata]|uniref:uncharacterized protein LOC141550721 n=1 Tax=Sminthopsis crassicaudata TaxID=9301 RepID=UPI003D698EFE